MIRLSALHKTIQKHNTNAKFRINIDLNEKKHRKKVYHEIFTPHQLPNMSAILKDMFFVSFLRFCVFFVI